VARPLCNAEQRGSRRPGNWPRQGWTQIQIAQHLGVHPKTVRRYLRSSAAAAGHRRQRSSRLDLFKPYLLQRWRAGCHNVTQLFREIELQGYPGKVTTVRNFIRQLRRGVSVEGSKPLSRPPSPRALARALFVHDTTDCNQAQQIGEFLRQAHPRCATTWNLAQRFVTLVRERQAEALDAWLERAEQSGDRHWQQLASGLRRDLAAVRAALQLPWSNGPTEGHVNRLKCL